MKKWGPILLGLALSGNVIAQENASINKGAFELRYANDVTGFTDQYYTNGVIFALTLPVFYHSPFNPRWLRNSNYSSDYNTLTFKYDVFTPDLEAELFSERPFSATMMLGSRHQYVYTQKSLRLTSEMQFGLIGQAAGAEKLQNGLHEIMPGAQRVEGWETQIRNDIGINYIFTVDKIINPSEYVEIIASMTTYLGVPYTKLEPAILIRAGLFEYYFNQLSNHRYRDWQAYVFLGGRGALVGYNATLQGGLFNQYNPYVLEEIHHLVGSYEIGLGAAYRNTSLVMSQTFSSPEFQGGDKHSWGELKIIFRF